MIYVCVFLWLSSRIYSTSLFFIITIFSLYNSTAIAHSSKQKNGRLSIIERSFSSLLCCCLSFIQNQYGARCCCWRCPDKKILFQKRTRERVIVRVKKRGERKKKITWYLFRKMFVFFFPFYTTRDSRHQFQRKRPGGGKIYERQQLMTDDNIFTHLYSSSISFLSNKSPAEGIYTTRISSSIQLCCDADGNDETQ